MLIVMAVETEQFPIAAVIRIICVVMVLVVDRQLLKLFTRKFPAAFCADPWKDF